MKKFNHLKASVFGFNFVLLQRFFKKVMEVVKTVTELREKLSAVRKDGKKVGFVPTMGALHNGHLSLVKRCVSENDVCVVSVFVNPTQFNDKNDLLKYPRTVDADVKLLASAGCSFAFVPEVEDIYPEEDTRVFDFGKVDKVMEGKYRPGHFNGVAQVVSRLFDIVEPDRAYFGEKDFQQIAVIRAMVAQLGYNVEIVACPIVREADGLALSSRNARLSDEQRKLAVKISETLFKSRTFADQNSVADTISFVTDTLNGISGLQVEYYEIVDGNTLQPIRSWNETSYAVGCITVYCGDVRLIDNIKY